MINENTSERESEGGEGEILRIDALIFAISTFHAVTEGRIMKRNQITYVAGSDTLS